MLFILYTITHKAFPVNHVISRTFYIRNNPLQSAYMQTPQTQTPSISTFPFRNIIPQTKIFITPLERTYSSDTLPYDSDNEYEYYRRDKRRNDGHLNYSSFGDEPKDKTDNDSQDDYNDYKGGKDRENEDSHRNMLSRARDAVAEFFSGFSIMKMLIFVLIAFLAVAIGYQIRKSEERANYVRLPAAQ